MSATSERVAHWLCAHCGRIRNSRFCPECGAKAVDRADHVASKLDHLLQIANILRSRQARSFNCAATLAQPGRATSPYASEQELNRAIDTYRQSAADAGELAATIEWAADQLEQRHRLAETTGASAR